MRHAECFLASRRFNRPASRRFNRDEEGVPAKWSLADGYPGHAEGFLARSLPRCRRLMPLYAVRCCSTSSTRRARSTSPRVTAVCALSGLSRASVSPWNHVEQRIPVAVRRRHFAVCTHKTFTKGRSIFCRSTENGPAFPCTRNIHKRQVHFLSLD